MTSLLTSTTILKRQLEANLPGRALLKKQPSRLVVYNYAYKVER